jgi:hypothetical protein
VARRYDHLSRRGASLILTIYIRKFVDRKSLRAVKKRAIIAEFIQWFNEHDPTDGKIVCYRCEYQRKPLVS